MLNQLYFKSTGNAVKTTGIGGPGSCSVSLGDIYTVLIREAAKCEAYASDLVYEIDAIRNLVEELNDASRLIGFRKCGVDGGNQVLQRGEDEISTKYFSLWRFSIKTIEEGCFAKKLEISLEPVEYVKNKED